MAGQAVIDAVTARLQANWTQCAIVEPNSVSGGPEDGAAYVTAEFPVAVENQITVGAPGNNVFRESGAFRIKLVSPSGGGTYEPNAWIEQLRRLFRTKQFDGVTTFAPGPAATDNSNYIAGKFVLSFAVPYYFDFLA